MNAGGPPDAIGEVLVIQPDPLDPMYELERWFAEARVGWTCVRPYAGEPVPEQLEADGLVVLGGDMSSLDDAGYPWLEDIRALQRDASDRQVPSLGICLGAQLMAQAFGGRTAVGDRGLETGVARVEWLPAAAADPVHAGLPNPFLAGTMHGDMVAELPEDATWLGTGPEYPHQAFRVGRTSWGVQFHPEINHAAYLTWVHNHRNPSEQDRERLTSGGEDLLAHEDVVLRGNRRLIGNFTGVLRAAADLGAASR